MIGFSFYCSAIHATPDLNGILRKSVLASGAADRSGCRVLGTARVRNSDQKFELDFDRNLRFRSRTMGALPDSFGFDGSTSWVEGSSGAPHRVILGLEEMDKLLTWVETGAWAKSSTPLVRTLTEKGVRLQLKGGIGEALLILDASTNLPASLTIREDEWKFADYKRFGKRTLATSLVHVSGGQTDTMNVTSAQPAQFAVQDFALPKPSVDGANFDPANTTPLELGRIGGLVLVHPKVDSEDVGWFILDTGADVMCIDPTVAKRLNMELVGQDSVAGSVAVAQYGFRRGKTFQVGPLTLNNPTYLELDLSGISKLLKMSIDGVCGYDFLARGIFDIDTKGNKLTILPSNARENVRWTPFKFDSNSPCARATFSGGGMGYYRLDTGSTSFLDFLSPTVERYGLIKNGKNLKSSMTGGAGGMTASKSGTVDWFELDGHRFEHSEVGLQMSKVGSLSTPYLDGNIGMGLMGKFRLILDYAHERIAFVNPSP